MMECGFSEPICLLLHGGRHGMGFCADGVLMFLFVLLASGLCTLLHLLLSLLLLYFLFSLLLSFAAAGAFFLFMGLPSSQAQRRSVNLLGFLLFGLFLSFHCYL